MDYTNQINDLFNNKFDGIIGFNDDENYQFYQQIHASERFVAEIDWDTVNVLTAYAKNLNDTSFMRFWKLISAGNTKNTIRFHSLNRDRIIQAILNREAHREAIYEVRPDSAAHKLRQEELKQFAAQVEAQRLSQING